MIAGPDQGYAWVVAFACFCINFIMAGLARTAGVLFVAVIDLYGVSREEATTPFSIRVCVRNLTGPLVGLLGQKYGIRGVTVIGGFVATLGSMLCFFAPSIIWITVFWGVIHGFGFGLSTVLHMITIGEYFDKYKASAMGLAYCGDCFGTFAFPVIMEYLISTYTVKGTFLLLGAIVLNVVPMALILKKPPWVKEKNKATKASKHKEKQEQIQGITQILNKHHETLRAQSQVKNVNKDNNFKRIDNENVVQKVNYSQNDFKRKPGFSGQYNKAFQCSETDLRTANSENQNCIKEDLAYGNVNCYKNEKYLGIPLQNPVVAKNLNSVYHHSSETNSFSAENINCKCVNSNSSNSPNVCDVVNRPARSVSDVVERNQYVSCLNKCNRFCVSQNQPLEERRDSLPPVLERELSLKDNGETNTGKIRNLCINSNEEEVPRHDNSGHLRTRNSSFIGQVAHEIVNKMRTASFASQVAQDGFIAVIPHEEDESEGESECELKSIVEHKDHDVETCTNKDIILSVHTSMECAKDAGDAHIVHENQTSVLKSLFETNTKPIFILISLSMAVYCFIFVSVITIIIDYAEDEGVPNSRGKYLVIGFSVADLFGRLVFGQVLDRKMMKLKNFVGSALILSGLLVAVIPLNPSYNYMMVCMSMYGFMQSAVGIIFPILVTTYMDKNSESVAMGCLNFYGGILMLLMAPMIGFFRDKAGSYNFVFYIIGGVTAIVGIIWQFEPMILKLQNKKLREKYVMKETVLNNAR